MFVRFRGIVRDAIQCGQATADVGEAILLVWPRSWITVRPGAAETEARPRPCQGRRGEPALPGRNLTAGFTTAYSISRGSVVAMLHLR